MQTMSWSRSCLVSLFLMALACLGLQGGHGPKVLELQSSKIRIEINSTALSDLQHLNLKVDHEAAPIAHNAATTPCKASLADTQAGLGIGLDVQGLLAVVEPLEPPGLKPSRGQLWASGSCSTSQASIENGNQNGKSKTCGRGIPFQQRRKKNKRAKERCIFYQCFRTRQETSILAMYVSTRYPMF